MSIPMVSSVQGTFFRRQLIDKARSFPIINHHQVLLLMYEYRTYKRRISPSPLAAEVYPVRGGLQSDPTKRGGRWQSDFIWNQDWKAALDYEEDVKRQIEEGRREAAEGAGSTNGKGFLSLTNKIDLNSMDVDLSAQLKPRKKPEKETSQTAPSKQQPRGARPPPSGGYPTVVPTRGETRAWERGGRYGIKVVATPPTAGDAEAAAARLAAETERYEQLKKELQFWATTLTAGCLAATYIFYGRDVAASYGVGAVGGLVYLRLLNRSVDAVAGGGIGGALGQQRLLIPVILALGYNRYNTMVAESWGLTLQLLPMLVGFFTYKGAVVARQSVALFGELTEPYKQKAGSENGDSGFPKDASTGMGGEGEVETGGGGAAAVDVISVDRAFARKVLSG